MRPDLPVAHPEMGPRTSGIDSDGVGCPPMFSKFIPWGAATRSEPRTSRRTGPTKWLRISLPVRLALLVAGTTLPLIVFATVLVLNDHAQDRKDATQRVLETGRSIRLVLDSEVQRMTGGLQCWR